MWTNSKEVVAELHFCCQQSKADFGHINCCIAIVSSKAIQTLDFARSRKVCGLFYIRWRFHSFDAESLGSTKIHLKGIEETRKSPHRQDSGLFHACRRPF
jgi:hypothetical protein